MISGIVIDRHAIVTITFRPPRLRDFPIQFVIDTGFTEEICLPPEAVALLGLPFKFNLPVNLADNSEVVLPVHSAIILWNGEEREIGVFATGRRPLVGTRLLEDHELVIQFVENGLVTIDNM